MKMQADNDDHATLGIDDRFAVVDEGSANWVVRKVREARAYADRVRAWAAAELRRSEREEKPCSIASAPNWKLGAARHSSSAATEAEASRFQRAVSASASRGRRSN